MMAVTFAARTELSHPVNFQMRRQLPMVRGQGKMNIPRLAEHPLP